MSSINKQKNINYKQYYEKKRKYNKVQRKLQKTEKRKSARMKETE